MNLDKEIVTLRICFYNHEMYVKDCVEHAFAQTYSPLQIIFSDDCSTDRTYEMLEQYVTNYDGPHEVLLNKTEVNHGVTAHINSVIPLVKGRLMVLGAGDDFSKADRVEKVYEKWVRMGKCSCGIFSLFQKVTDVGELMEIDGGGADRGNDDIMHVSRHDDRLFSHYPGCAPAFTKDQYAIFGDLDEAIIQNDISRQLRAGLLGGIGMINEPLVYYRQTPHSLSRIGKRPFKEWKNKRIGYIDSFFVMMKQFEKDLLTALDNKLITKANFIWAQSCVKKYLQERQIEKAFYESGFTDRIRYMLQMRSRRRMPFRSFIEAISPSFYHLLRR